VRRLETQMDGTLLKGLQILTHVARAKGGVRITDVAADLELTKSNAYRALKTLEFAGFLRQDPHNKEFSPSLKLWELGMDVLNKFDLKALAGDALRGLAARSRETVHLAILEDQEVLYIEKIDSPEPVSAYTRLGGRAPAYCVATGKALLSRRRDAELAPILENLAPHSPNTITDPEKLRRGYAINRGEWRESVWGIAAVVGDPNSAIEMAVGVSGPGFRFEAEGRCQELAAMVMEAAREISAAIR
jgi:IclR family KDG regulon transcriptional repressor